MIPMFPSANMYYSLNAQYHNIQLKNPLGQDLWCGTRAQATSVRILGETQTKCGLTLRPDFPYRADLVRLLKEYFATHPTGPFVIPDKSQLIHVPAAEIDTEDLRDGWKQRVYRYRNVNK